MKIIKKIWSFYESRPYLGLVAVLIILVVNLLADINYPYFPRSDSGAQIIAAKALATGKGYRDISNPWDAPFILYPPVFSLILALPIAIWGINYLAMKICVALFAVGSLIILYFLFKKFIDPKIVPLLLLLLIFSGFYNYSIRIQSEIPFIFFTLSAIFFMEKYGCSPKVLTMDLLGVVLFFNLSQFTKLVGFSLPVAAIFYLLAKHSSPSGVPRTTKTDIPPLPGGPTRQGERVRVRGIVNLFSNQYFPNNLRSRFRLKLCKIGLVMLLTMLPFWIYLYQVNPGYVSKKHNPFLVNKLSSSGISPFVYQRLKLFHNSKDALFYFLPKCLLRDDLNLWIELDKKMLPAEAIWSGAIGNYWQIPGLKVLYNPDWPVRKELSLFLLITLFIVFVTRNIKSPDFMSLYFLIYLITILTSPWEYEIPRYLVPIIPLCIFYLYQGLVSVGSLLRTMGSAIFSSERFIVNPRVFSCTVLILLFGFELSMGFNKHYSDPWNSKGKWNIINQCEWVKMNTRPDEVILCVDKYLMYLFTGRKAFSFVPWEREKEHFMFGLDWYLTVGGQIDYAVFSKGDSKMVWAIIKDSRYKFKLKGNEEVYKDFIVIRFSRGEVGTASQGDT
jgi:hypothetical protein